MELVILHLDIRKWRYMVTVVELIQEIFDEPNYESNGALSDFTLQRGFNTHSVRIIERDFHTKIFKVIEILDRRGEIGTIRRTNYFETLEELDLHLKNIRKGYPKFEFRSKFMLR